LYQFLIFSTLKEQPFFSTTPECAFMKNSILFLASLCVFDAIPAVGLAAPTVVSVSPVLQSRSASRTAEITIVFDMPMDPSTINAANIKVFGQWSGVASGQFSLQNNNTQVRFAPSTHRENMTPLVLFSSLL
jgi:hypothetical protein